MTDERMTKVEKEIALLREHVEFVKGKALGLEAAALVFARKWNNDPQAVIEALHNAMENLDSPNASPTLEGEQKKVAIALVEQVSSAMHSRNR